MARSVCRSIRPLAAHWDKGLCAGDAAYLIKPENIDLQLIGLQLQDFICAALGAQKHLAPPPERMPPSHWPLWPSLLLARGGNRPIADARSSRKLRSTANIESDGKELFIG